MIIKTTEDAVKFIKKARLVKGWTLEQTAKEYGVSMTCIWYYENKTRIVPLEYVLFWSSIEVRL